MTDEIEQAEEAIKIGRRNSAADAGRIQAAHDTLADLGAVCRSPDLEVEIPIDAEKTLVSFGDAIKAVPAEGGGIKLGGYLVRFTSADDPDLSPYRDFFTRDTDFDVEQWPVRSTVYFNHGMDPVVKRRKFDRATLTLDDVGVWAETILQERDEYEKMLVRLATAGKLGWSSGTAVHLYEREPVGKSHKVTRWPLGLDASLTHTPAEPRNTVIPLKSLLSVDEQEASEPVAEAAGQDAPEASEQNQDAITKRCVMEITEDRLEEMMSAAAEKALKSLPAPETAGGVEVVTDAADQPWKSAGEWLKAIKQAAIDPRTEDVRLRSTKAATGMSEGVPSDGGYLVHPQFAGGILERMYQTGEILRRVSQDPVSGLSMVYNGVDETSRADGSQWGGLIAYWTAEAGSYTSSKPAFREVELKLKKVTALAYATEEQLNDTPNLQSWLMRTVPELLRTKVETAIYRGTGVGQPQGVINANCVVSPLREDANYIKLSDVLNMYKRRWPGGRYVWMIHQDAFPQILQLAGTNLTNLFMPYGSIAGVPYNTLMGLPIIEIEQASTLGTYGDFALVDLSQYQTIVNGGIQSASSIHVSFTTGEQAFRWSYRIDGNALWHSALTPMNGSNTMSPFVVLSAVSV